MHAKPLQLIYSTTGKKFPITVKGNNQNNSIVDR